MATTESQWSQLPGDILKVIAKRLDSQIDTLRLRSVCHSWRSSIVPFKHTPLFPLTLPFPILPNPSINVNRHGHFNLSQSTTYFILPPPLECTSKSNKPWLFRAEELSNGKRRPLNPLSRIIIENMPPDFPKELNLLGFPIFEIGRAFSLTYVETSGNDFESTFSELKSLFVKKVVVSSDPFTTGSDDFEIVVISCGKLGFIRLGDDGWRLIDDVKQSDDVVYHKGKFYVVDLKGNTIVIGSDLKVERVADSIPYGGGQFKYLAKFNEDLYLIDKYMEAEVQMSYDDDLDDYCPDVMNPDVEVHFKLYKLNEAHKKWDWIGSLGDKSVFVGDDCSYVVSVKDFVGLKPNCIYFLDESFVDENENLGDFCSDIGVYNLEDSMCGPLASFKSHSKIIWPPPSWLQPKKLSSKKKKRSSKKKGTCH